MKILFVYLGTLKSSSSGVIRNRAFIKGVRELGHEIDIIMLDDRFSVNYDDAIDMKEDFNNIQLIEMGWFYKFILLIKDKKRRKQNNDCKLKITEKSKSYSCLKPNIINHLKYILSFDLRVFNRKLLHLDNQYDLVISSSDPKCSHTYTKRLIKHNDLNCPWIQYWGDPLADDINYTVNSFEKKIVLIRENKILKEASAIIYTSPLTLERQKVFFPQHSAKMKFVNQACLDVETDENGPCDRYVLGYFGDYHKRTRNMIPLIDAVSNMRDVDLIIAGNGEIDIETNILQNIEIYGRCKKAELKKLESKTNIVIGVCNKIGGQIPAKFYYVAGTQKPIIVIADGEYIEQIIDFFKSFSRYIVCQNTQNEIAAAINIAKHEISSKREYVVPDEMFPTSVARRIIESVNEVTVQD